eukprot:3930452-Prymnesium_polylepis.1
MKAAADDHVPLLGASPSYGSGVRSEVSAKCASQAASGSKSEVAALLMKAAGAVAAAEPLSVAQWRLKGPCSSDLVKRSAVF